MFEASESAGLTPEEHELEEKHYLRVLKSFTQYRFHSLATNSKRRNDFESIPPRHRDLIKSAHIAKLNAIDMRINKNTAFIGSLISHDRELLATEEFRDIKVSGTMKSRTT
jgi:hypothetical protein